MARYLTVSFWQAFWQHTVEAVTGAGLKIVGIILLYVIARKVTHRLIDAALARLLARQAERGRGADHGSRLLTLQGLVKSITGYVLFFLFAIMVLDALSVNVAGIITTAGVGGLAFGFGAQKLVRDVISGFFLIVEDQFVVGDYVTIGAATGIVEELGMRITRIRDDQGRLWILANGDIVTVTNHSRAPVEAFIEVGIAPGADVEQARRIIDEIGRNLYDTARGQLTAVPKYLGVSGWDAAHILLRVAVVATPSALSAEHLRVREAILEAFRHAQVLVA